MWWRLERSLVYPAESAADHWEEPPDPAIEEQTFCGPDGVSLHGWYLAQPESPHAVVYCHGQGGNLSYLGRIMLRIRQFLGCSVLVFDYPGYGKSGGRPTEAGCYASAEAALDWLQRAKGIGSEKVTLIGDSLGGGVAVEVARRRTCRALVLCKSFTSLPAAARRRFWILRALPVSWFMCNQFDNLAKLPDVDVPVLIASATLDRIVPFAMGEQLYRAANEPKLFLPLEGQEHHSKMTDDFLIAVRQFLEGQADSGKRASEGE